MRLRCRGLSPPWTLMPSWSLRASHRCDTFGFFRSELKTLLLPCSSSAHRAWRTCSCDKLPRTRGKQNLLNIVFVVDIDDLLELAGFPQVRRPWFVRYRLKRPCCHAEVLLTNLSSCKVCMNQAHLVCAIDMDVLLELTGGHRCNSRHQNSLDNTVVV
jgi:hypothetical protein